MSQNMNKKMQTNETTNANCSKMNTISALPRPSLVLLVVMVVAVFPPTSKSDETIALEVRQALETNATKLSPLTVTWDRKRKSPETVERALNVIGLPKTAFEFFGDEKCRFMWSQGKFYTYFWRTQPFVTAESQVDLESPMVVVEQEIACNGKKFFSGNPNTSGGKKLHDAIIIVDSLQKLSKQRILTADFVYQAGFRLPENADSVATASPVSLLLEELSLGGQLQQVTTIEIGGASFTQVDVQMDGEKHLFVLDPKRNYALRRRTTYYKTGDISANVDCDDFVQLTDTPLWFPRRIKVEMYFPGYSNTKPLVLEEYVVSELHNNPIPDSQFVLEYKEPGTHVADGTLPGAETKESGRVSYVVPADPKDLDKAIELATYGLQQKRGLPWFLIGNLVLLTCFVVGILLYRSRKSS
jgi:hypothetical protein